MIEKQISTSYIGDIILSYISMFLQKFWYISKMSGHAHKFL